MYSRNGQTRKHTTGQDKRDGDTQEKPALSIVVRWDLLPSGLEGRVAKGHGQRGHHGREGVEEADEGEASSPHRAIGGCAWTRSAHGHGKHLSAGR